MLRVVIGLSAYLATTGAALAGTVVAPGPEAGMGIASIVALGLGLAWMRRRKSR